MKDYQDLEEISDHSMPTVHVINEELRRKGGTHLLQADTSSASQRKHPALGLATALALMLHLYGTGEPTQREGSQQPRRLDYQLDGT